MKFKNGTFCQLFIDARLLGEQTRETASRNSERRQLLFSAPSKSLDNGPLNGGNLASRTIFLNAERSAYHWT